MVPGLERAIILAIILIVIGSTSLAIDEVERGVRPDGFAVRKIQDGANGDADHEGAIHGAVDGWNPFHVPLGDAKTHVMAAHNHDGDDAANQIKAKLAGASEQWAASLDARGKPASTILDEHKKLLAAGGRRPIEEAFA